MSIELRKRITLHNEKGEETYDSGDQPSNSFCKAFLAQLQVMFGNVVAPTGVVKTTAAVEYAAVNDTFWSGADYPFSIDADTDQSLWGILIGDDATTPEANGNFRLDSVIEAGAGAGQVNYGVTGWAAGVTVDGDECSWSFNRVMTNNSGAGIEVKEIGAYIRIQSTPIHYAMILRDTLTPTITIPDGETMTVQYTLKTVV